MQKKIFKVFIFLVFLSNIPALANISLPGQVIREARCKILIRGPLSVLVGDELSVSRRPEGQGGVIGQIKILKVTPTRLTAMVIDERHDCRKFMSGYVHQKKTSLAENQVKESALPMNKSVPSMKRLQLGAGPGLLNTNLRGISREVPGQEFVEDYPLILTSLNLFGDVFPFAFLKTNAGIAQNIGFEGLFRYILASSPIQVATPAPGTGEEVNLELEVKRIHARGGLILRIPVWKDRFFGDLRSGYYLSRLTSSITRFTKTPEGKPNPFELSPLRDLGLVGIYSLAGAQFLPTQSSWLRLSAGSLFSSNYQIENRPLTATRETSSLSTKVQNPSFFIFESQLGYTFKSLQLGLGLSFENFTGSSFFPDGQTQGDLGEIYFSYGLNLSFLL